MISPSTPAFFLCAAFLYTANTIAQVPTTTAPTTSTQATSNTTVSVPVGQTITFNSTTYQVTAKKQLAEGVEYYTVKASTPKAKAVNYLRSNGAYNPTVFTQAQYESFLKTGKVSSFGVLASTKLDGQVVWSTTRTTAKAYFTQDGDKGVFIAEVPTSQVAALENNNDGGGSFYCTLFCSSCCGRAKESCDEGPVQSPDEAYCQKEYNKCREGCSARLSNTSIATHALRSSLVVVK